MSATQVISLQDFDSICRLCLQRSNNGALTAIFNGRRRGDVIAAATDDDNEDAAEMDWGGMVGDLTGLEMNANDGLPLGVCNSCQYQLAECHTFRQQCITSVEVLLALKTSDTVKIEHRDFGTEQYIVEETAFTEWHEDNEVAEVDHDDGHHHTDAGSVPDSIEADSKDHKHISTVSSHLQIETLAYADETLAPPSESSPVIGMRIKSSPKKARKPYTVVATMRPPKLEEYSDADDGAKAELIVPVVKRGRKPKGTIKLENANSKSTKQPKMEQCEVCGFISRSLRTHMMTHTNEKKYECDFCGKKFALRSSMKNHLFAHVNIRPYRCKFCPATFSTPSVLGYHMDMHRGPAFSCEVCGRQFHQNYSLTKHLKTHQQVRPHACAHCPQAFLTAEGLRNHVGKHTGVSSFKCGLCPSAFNCTAKSSAHRRRHLVDGEYQCERCSYRVKSFAVFKTHLMACCPELLML